MKESEGLCVSVRGNEEKGAAEAKYARAECDSKQKSDLSQNGHKSQSQQSFIGVIVNIYDTAKAY